MSIHHRGWMLLLINLLQCSRNIPWVCIVAMMGLAWRIVVSCFLSCCSSDDSDQSARRHALNELEEIVASLWPGCCCPVLFQLTVCTGGRVETFGSSASGLATKQSDVDVGLFGLP